MKNSEILIEIALKNIRKSFKVDKFLEEKKMRKRDQI
jgi:hypothetical protein